MASWRMNTRRFNTVRRRLTAMALAVALASSCLQARADNAVVTNAYLNPDGAPAVRETPVTFSRIGAAGDFTAGVTPVVGGRELPAQVDVLRRAEDGSIRHALVTFVVPSLASGGELKVSYLNKAPAAPAEFVWAVPPEAFDLQLVLKRKGGGVLTSNIAKRLGADWAKGDRVKVLHDGPLMKEFEIHDVPHDENGSVSRNFDVFWRLRVFSGLKSVRVSVVVERCRMWNDKMRPWKAFHDFDGMEVRLGEKVLHAEKAYRHLDMCRYRVVTWTAGEMERIERRPNYAYWVKGKFVPLFRKTRDFTAAQAEGDFRRKLTRHIAPGEARILHEGIIHNHMPGTGGRPDIGPYPDWAVVYLLVGGSKLYRANLHADGNGGGAFYIHARQDPDTPGYDVKNFVRPKGGPRTMPSRRETRTKPDGAHTPAIGYITYLLTGDKYYAEEMSFWASYQLSFYPYRGLTTSFPLRHQAWGLRMVVDAAFILPTGHPLQGYFTKSVNTYLARFDPLIQSPRKIHYVRDRYTRSGMAHLINVNTCAPWQHSWLIWSLHNAVLKGFDNAREPRAWVAAYTIGLYTSKDEYVAPDGKTYTFDPRDANQYFLATSLMKATPTTRTAKKVVTVDGKEVKKEVQVRTVRVDRKSAVPIDNYGAVWYWSKVNWDNSYYEYAGKDLDVRPDDNGVWPIREKGWGHGMKYSRFRKKQERAYPWHRYGAWNGLTAAYEADIPGAKEAYDVMTKLAGGAGKRNRKYAFEMVPQVAR